MPETPMWRRHQRLRGADVAADVDEELRFHLEMRTEALVARGMSPEAAREEARRRLGDVAGVSRACRSIGEETQRQQSRRERLAGVGQELRRALRGLLRSPGFTAVTALTLALGMGATATIFSLLDAVVLRPLPYPAANRLVVVQHPVPGIKADARWGLSAAGSLYLREHSRTLEELGTFTADAVTLTGEGPAERVPSARISASLFGVLGARPQLGRLLAEEDNRVVRNAEGQPGAVPVAVLGHDFWRRRFGGDPAVLGRTLEIDARRVQVVGVLAPGFGLPDQPVDLWLPRPLDPAAPAVNSHFLSAVGRLRPGVEPAQARAELARLAARFPEVFPEAYSPSFMSSTGFAVDVVPLRDHVVGAAARVLWILLGSVGLLLLIAGVNAANLFLVRAEARRRELAIRTALGAARGHLAWHSLSESLLLALGAGLCALALAWAALRLLVATAPAGIPRLAEVHVGPNTLAFVAALSLLAGVLFGVFPLLRTRGSLSVLRDGGRGLTASRRQQRVRGVLVAGQVALALVLLAAAGLLLRSFQNLQRVEPGFRAEGVLAVDVALPWARYDSEEKIAAFYQELIARVGALPGVTGVATTEALPLASAGSGGEAMCSAISVEDRPAGRNEVGCVGTQRASPGLFRTLAIPLAQGRAYEWADGGTAVVVSRALAERLWPGQDPIGKGIKGGESRPPYFRVVGVTGDVRANGLDRPAAEMVYFPLRWVQGQNPPWGPPAYMTLVVRTTTEQPEALTAGIRRVLTELDPNVPLADPRTLEGVVARSMSRVSFTLILLATAAAMALALSAVGLYGVIAYLVGQRRPEMGLRMALGAQAGQVTGLVVMQSVRLVAAGTVVGLVGALAATRTLQSLLFGVSPADPATLAVVTTLLLALAVAASWMPARRAGRVDPSEMLRAE